MIGDREGDSFLDHDPSRPELRAYYRRLYADRPVSVIGALFIRKNGQLEVREPPPASYGGFMREPVYIKPAVSPEEMDRRIAAGDPLALVTSYYVRDWRRTLTLCDERERRRFLIEVWSEVGLTVGEYRPRFAVADENGSPG